MSVLGLVLTRRAWGRSASGAECQMVLRPQVMLGCRVSGADTWARSFVPKMKGKGREEWRSPAVSEGLDSAQPSFPPASTRGCHMHTTEWDLGCEAS